MTAKLSDQKIREALAADLTGWTLQDGQLHREYRFRDFVHAFGFMATCATHIQQQDHHPAWNNVWNRVTVDLSTHDAGGITEKDIALARFMESIATKLGA